MGESRACGCVVLGSSMIRLVLVASLTFGIPLSSIAADPCVANVDACAAPCKQYDGDEAKLAECKSSCGAAPNQCEPINAEGQTETPAAAATESAKPEFSPSANAAPIESSREEATTSTEPQAGAPVSGSEAAPAAPKLNVSAPSGATKPKSAGITKSAMLDELQKNSQMLAAIKAGDLKTIRRLIELKGLDPTYVYAYTRNPETDLFEANPARLRLVDVFNDANELRRDSSGLDRILAVFIELGMDVKATLGGKTAWGPDLRVMEKAKDRAARFRAFEMALAAGLPPNDDLGERIFAELPQICGRDRSQFAIQVVDLLIKHVGPPLKDRFRRNVEGGSETLSAVLDRSYASRTAKYAYEAQEFAKQDAAFENCAPLSRRINRYLTKGE